MSKQRAAERAALMFHRFTDQARHTVVLAQEEARVLKHEHIGTEHLLLGLVANRDSVAARALAAEGVDLETARRHVGDIVGTGVAAPSGHIPFTPRAKKVLELSLREAIELGHNHIGTEHLLLAIVREGEGIAAQVLQQVGAGAASVRAVVLDLAGTEDAASTAATDPGRHDLLPAGGRLAPPGGPEGLVPGPWLLAAVVFSVLTAGAWAGGSDGPGRAVSIAAALSAVPLALLAAATRSVMRSQLAIVFAAGTTVSLAAASAGAILGLL